MKPQSVFALGVGSFTPVLLDLALACGYEIAGLYHYAPGRSGQQVRGYPVLGTFAELWQSSLGGRKFMLTMGANHLRLDLAERIAAAGGQLPTLIHPQAQVSLWADLSPCGVYVLPCSCIQAGAVIDACCIINEQAVICHDSHLARGCFIAAQCVIGARTSVGAGVCMGLGAMCIPDKVHHIGPAARIAARALLTRDVPAGAFMMGAPAREMPYPPLHLICTTAGADSHPGLRHGPGHRPAGSRAARPAAAGSLRPGRVLPAGSLQRAALRALHRFSAAPLTSHDPLSVTVPVPEDRWAASI